MDSGRERSDSERKSVAPGAVEKKKSSKKERKSSHHKKSRHKWSPRSPAGHRDEGKKDEKRVDKKEGEKSDKRGHKKEHKKDEDINKKEHKHKKDHYDKKEHKKEKKGHKESSDHRSTASARAPPAQLPQHNMPTASMNMPTAAEGVPLQEELSRAVQPKAAVQQLGRVAVPTKIVEKRCDLLAPSPLNANASDGSGARGSDKVQKKEKKADEAEEYWVDLRSVDEKRAEKRQHNRREALIHVENLRMRHGLNERLPPWVVGSGNGAYFKVHCKLCNREAYPEQFLGNTHRDSALHRKRWEQYLLYGADSMDLKPATGLPPASIWDQGPVTIDGSILLLSICL
eukprot:g14396.t1